MPVETVESIIREIARNHPHRSLSDTLVSVYVVRIKAALAALQAELAAVPQLVRKADPKGDAMRAGGAFADGYAKAIEDALEVIASEYKGMGVTIRAVITRLRALQPRAATAAPIENRRKRTRRMRTENPAVYAERRINYQDRRKPTAAPAGGSDGAGNRA